jgi:hypothetical protein
MSMMSKANNVTAIVASLARTNSSMRTYVTDSFEVLPPTSVLNRTWERRGGCLTYWQADDGGCAKPRLVPESLGGPPMAGANNRG